MNERYRTITDFFELLEFAALEKIKILEQNPYLTEFIIRCFYADRETAAMDLNQMVNNATSGAFESYFNILLQEFSHPLSGGEMNCLYPSSKTCSCCGRIKKELGLDERIYRCECGNQMDRDENAAINIRGEGLRMLGITQERSS